MRRWYGRRPRGARPRPGSRVPTVRHRLGVDESLRLRDLDELTYEPHRHRAARGLDLHRNLAGLRGVGPTRSPRQWRPPGRTRRRTPPGRSTSATPLRAMPRMCGSGVRRCRCLVIGCSLLPRGSGHVRVEPVKRAFQVARQAAAQLKAASRASGWSTQGRNWARRPRWIRPAPSSTLRCLETAGRVRLNGSASSLTVASPSASRTKIARRVVLASAAKVASSRSSSMDVTSTFIMVN